jgi:ubiquinone/menaquinone biosynthesis C-methylase UbiE
MPNRRLSHGLIRIPSYQALLRDPMYLDMERFSDDFVSAHNQLLAPYKNRWVSDPLHQWSRRWEYPFVLAELEPVLNRSTSAAVLDAGSGITFFPYYVASKFRNTQVCCADADITLAALHRTVNQQTGAAVSFLRTDIGNLSMPDRSFDAIYCISVLEHTGHYEKIIDEFVRLLRPQGRLILTFDISLDGNADIPIDKADALLAALHDRLRAVESSPRAVGTIGDDVITTEYFRKYDPWSLPWKYPRLSGMLASVARGKFPRFAMKRLAVSCHSFEKPA